MFRGPLHTRRIHTLDIQTPPQEVFECLGIHGIIPINSLQYIYHTNQSNVNMNPRSPSRKPTRRILLPIGR